MTRRTTARPRASRPATGLAGLSRAELVALADRNAHAAPNPAHLASALAPPAQALDPARLYLGDNGRCTCGARRCAGVTASTTGRDLSGQRMLAIDAATALENGFACETCGLRPADALPSEVAWICHARPAALGGRPCGHVNATGGVLYGARQIECCAGCGCTRKASDDRARKEG